MSTLPPCPQCHCEYTYEDGGLLICPECAHEWAPEAAPAPQQARVWKDAHGNVLQDGDAVTTLHVEVDATQHCKIDGFGAMQLKSEFVKKA